MPPSHPRPEQLTALGAALSATAEHAVGAGEQLLDHMVTVGDHTTQAAVDDLLDQAVDAVRELSAGCRELALSLGAFTGASTRTSTADRGPDRSVTEPRSALP